MHYPDTCLRPPEIKDSFSYDRDDRNEFEIKAEEVTTEGEFTGYASVFGKVDLQDEIVEKGAFKRTLERKRGRFPIFWNHQIGEPPLGEITEAKEDQKGLLVKGNIIPTIERGNHVLTLMRKKIIRTMSIGFRVIVDEYDRDKDIRHLKEIDLWEVSPVTFAANPAARIHTVKAVVPYQNLPMASPDRGWDSSAAVKRVKSWSGSDETANARFRRAFTWYDAESPQNFTSYKLLIADVIDGELVAVPRAVFAAAAAVQGARGGVSIPEGDRDRVRAHLTRYYRRLDRTPPWEGQSSVNELIQHALDLHEWADPELVATLRRAIEVHKDEDPSLAPFSYLDEWLPSGRKSDSDGPETALDMSAFDQLVNNWKKTG